MRTIEYEEVDSGQYKHQVTVTSYPSRLAAMFGAKPVARVFVKEWMTPGYEDVGWYEVPDFSPLSCIGALSAAIARTIRQQEFTDSVPSSTQEEQ